MSSCTFFGHRDAPNTIEPDLRAAVIDLIEHKGVDLFYLGNQGAFDRTVIKTLRLLKEKYPRINYYVVLAYIPHKKEGLAIEDGESTLYPDCLDKTPTKYAIAKRNMWLIEKSDFVITYVTHITGGAADFKAIAERKCKKVINITE